MATLSLRLHQLGKQGYDVVHYETNSSIVLRPDKTDVEATLQAIEQKLQSAAVMQYSEVLPATIAPGTIIVVNDSVYIGRQDGVPLHIAGPELTISQMEVEDV